jgi:hypothetical protein
MILVLVVSVSASALSIDVHHCYITIIIHVVVDSSILSPMGLTKLVTRASGDHHCKGKLPSMTVDT